MLVHKLIPLFALGLNVLLLGSAFANDRKSHRNYVFAYLAMALAAWNLGVFGLRSSGDPATALLWERLLHLGVIPIPVLFYHYVLAFLDQSRRRPSLVAGYALCACFLAVSPTPFFMRGVTDTYWGYAPTSGPLYAPFFVYFWAFLVMGLVRLLRTYRSMVASFRRNRTRLVLFGVGVSLLGGIVDFARFILGWEHLYPVGIPSNAIFAVALGIAIVRYRLLDVGILAKRVMLYLLLSISAAPFLVFGVYLVDRFEAFPLSADGTPHPNVPLLLALFALVVAALPLLRKVQQGLEVVIFARQHGVRDALAALSKDMASVLDIEELGRTLTDGLVTRVPVVHASLHVVTSPPDVFVPFARTVSTAVEGERSSPSVDGMLTLWLRLTRKPLGVEELALQNGLDAKTLAVVGELEAARVALLVPLFMDGELAAILMLGEKVSGEVFDGAEIDLLDRLMGQTAIALKNARLYDDLRTRMDELQRTQQQLIQSAKLAAIGELAAGVAHEINNPLTIVLGNSALLLRQTAEDSPARERLQRIESEAMRAGKIARDLLSFSRRREPKFEPLVIGDVVRRSIDLLASKLKQVEVETVFDPAAPWLMGDVDQLVQVFINLIGNAADAMPEGGTIAVQTDLREQSGQVAIRVIDRGVGIPLEQVSRIFEPFFTTKPESRGTGLGLSVSLGIVKNHGGTIEVDSEVGKGTTMTVLLPLGAASRGAEGR